MKNAKYIQNDGSVDGTASILIYDYIGSYIDESGEVCEGVDGSRFALEMEFLQAVGAKKIDIRINSFGGRVSDGLAIISSILHCKIPCNTIVDGCAYSMAGLVAICGKKRSMMDFALIMAHNPEGTDKKMLAMIRDSLMVIFKNNTNLSEEQLDKMMNDETYLNAEDALELGFIDKIIKTGKNVNVNTKTSVKEMFAMYNALLIPKQNKMEDKNLSTDNITEALTKKLEDLKNQLESETKEKAELKAKLDAIEKAETEKREAVIEEMVNGFVGSAINAEEKASTITLARVDFDGVKNMLTKIGSTKSVDVFAAAQKTVPVTDSAWTYEDFSKKDPEGLKKIKTENPERFTELLNAYIKK